MLSNAELFDFPARPPTPPKDSCSNTPESALILSGELSNANLQLFAQVAACDTPPQNSPSSSAESDKPRKRVGFSPWTDYHKAPIFSSKAAATDSLLRQLPPSKERRSSKSILKPCTHLTPLGPGNINEGRSGSISAHKYGSFAEMLESIIQQLAGEDRNGRLDSYITLEGTLKAYDGIPDPKAMGAKMGLFMDFIRRDMCATMSGTNAVDTNLATHALKLLIIFLWTPSLSGCLTDEFRMFIVDHSTGALEDPRVPKALVNHHMRLLSQQEFTTKIMNTDRANRLISALDEIEEHVRGNSILAERILIYQKLVRQARGAMIVRVEDWLDHLFSAMLSSIREIRVRAIALGIDGGLALGTSSQVSRAVMDVFNRELEGGKFIEHLSERLQRMMAIKEEAMYIPQIWSVVILFLRSRRHQIGQWQHFKGWLNIIQKCFNTSDIAVKFQANVAWNRLIFAIDLGTDIGVSMTKVLRQPITGQMDRRGNDSYSKKARNVAFASYCNLLYYSLRPSSSFQHVDYFWEEYVSQVLQKTLARSPEDVKLGCQILISLLDSPQSKVWNENRANELAPVKPEELHRLDPRWVRLRAHVLLHEIELTLSQASWNTDSGTEAPVRSLWRNFMRSIADAGNKEVKMSSELATAIAHIFNMLRRTWIDGTPTLGLSKDSRAGSDLFLERFSFLVTSAIDILGAVHFTEKVLTQDSQSLFEAAASPSNRSSRNLEAPRSPLIHLLQLLLVAPDDFKATESFYTVFKNVLERCCYSRSSRRMRLELLRESAQLLSDLNATTNDACCPRCWQVIAELIKASIADTTSESPKDSPQQLGHEYREIVKILDVGRMLQSDEHSDIWSALYITFATHVARETGDGGLVLAAVEPLAHTIPSEDGSQSSNNMLFASIILDKATFPKNQQSLDLGHKRLWDILPFSKKTAVFRPFDHLYEMIDSLLTGSYRGPQVFDFDHIVRFFASLTAFLHRCPLSLLVNCLTRIQDGIGLWIQDPESRIRSQEARLREVGLAITSLWTNITANLESLNRNDSTLLKTLEELVACGLSSRRRVILTASIKYWNSTFGQEEALLYPAKVQSALAKLRSVAEIQLPTFPETSQDQATETPLRFSDTQDDLGLAEEALSAASFGANYLLAPKTIRPDSVSPASRRLAVRSPSAFQSRHSTPEPHPKRTPSRKAPTARLRHDDSQIVFATISSSPLDTSAMESQLMTDRQREVRDRQRAQAAAMFPDIRSSPRAKKSHSKVDLPPFTLSSDRPSTGELVVDGPMTPTLPPTHMEGFLGSSPTPRPETSDIIQSSSPSNENAVPASLSYDYPDVPSSPPQAAVSTEWRSARQSSLEMSRIEDSQMHDAQLEVAIPSRITSLDDNQQDYPGELEGPQPATMEIDELGLDANDSPEQSTTRPLSSSPAASRDATHPEVEHENPNLDRKLRQPGVSKDQSKRLRPLEDREMIMSDVFMDALSSPPEPSDARDREDEVFVDASQSPLRTTKEISEGIDPRLTTNMTAEDISIGTSPVQDDFSRVLDSIYNSSSEQATPRYNQSAPAVSINKADEHLQEIRQTSVAESCTSSQGSRTKKRKRALSKMPKKRGRPKRSISDADSQNDILQEATQDEIIYDCIVVDNSQVTGVSIPSSAEVKPEQSPSPVKGTENPFSPPFRVIIRKPSVSDLAPSQAAGGDMSSRSRKRSASAATNDDSGRSASANNNNDQSQITSTTQSKRRKSSRLSRDSTASLIEDRPDEGFASLASVIDDGDSTRLPDKNDEMVRASITHESTTAQTTPASKSIMTSYDDTCPDTDQALEDQINAEITSSRSRAKTPRILPNNGRNPTEQLHHPKDQQVVKKTIPSNEPHSQNPEQETLPPLSVSKTAISVDEKLHTVYPSEIKTTITLSLNPTTEDKPTIQDIKATLTKALRQLRKATIGRDELRELDDVLFDVRTEAHQASKRSTT
ncbi:MAG: hypothetical protein M1812_005930 [Candelaria pacifica]|nr:MAG: hypothetical protein M1812_005930 [Candelaria pacifica]